MGLAILILGLVVTIGSHLFVTFRESRAAAIARFGQNGYRAVFSLVSVVGLVLLVWGYSNTAWIAVWSPPAFMRHITIGLMLIASILLVAYFVPSRIKSKAKHPLLAAVKTWAFAHLLSNGNLASILLFGSFLAWGVYARIAAKRRGDEGPQSVPAGATNDIIVVVVGIVVYLALGFAFHPLVLHRPVFFVG